jgi:hypothetical protein
VKAQNTQLFKRSFHNGNTQVVKNGNFDCFLTKNGNFNLKSDKNGIQLWFKIIILNVKFLFFAHLISVFRTLVSITLRKKLSH